MTLDLQKANVEIPYEWDRYWVLYCCGTGSLICLVLGALALRGLLEWYWLAMSVVGWVAAAGASEWAVREHNQRVVHRLRSLVSKLSSTDLEMVASDRRGKNWTVAPERRIPERIARVAAELQSEKEGAKGRP